MLKLGLPLVSCMALMGCKTTVDRETNAASETSPGSTVMYFDPFHGYQIVFFETPETSWLWYPGNRTSLPALVRYKGSDVCFKYGSHTFNPVIGKQGGSWDCTPRFILDGLAVASGEGDIFGLSDGTVPYRRRKCDGTDGFARVNVDPGLYKQGCG